MAWLDVMDTRTLARFVAGGLGTGSAPKAPGTAGSLAALVAGGLLLCWSPWAVAAAFAVTVPLGLWAIGASGVEGDPGWVVIDEFAGQFAAVAALARPSVAGLALAFVLFRALDIAKPGPIGWADRRPGPVGIMADDVIAGLIAACLIGAIRWRWPDALG